MSRRVLGHESVVICYALTGEACAHGKWVVCWISFKTYAGERAETHVEKEYLALMRSLFLRPALDAAGSEARGDACRWYKRRPPHLSSQAPS